MNSRRSASTFALAFCLMIPLDAANFPNSTAIGPVSTLAQWSGGDAFTHQTGRRRGHAWLATYRLDPPGYVVRGRANGGDALAEGVYEYAFSFTLSRGGVGGIFQRAHDVVRVEAWDVTTQECLVSRTFQRADFRSSARTATRKTLLFSSNGRHDHMFEPRIYWPGLSGFCLREIALHRIATLLTGELDTKADLLERAMGDKYLRDGYVLAARENGDADDYGDSAVWTGLYAAAEGWRYQATHDREAMKRLESSLWALHRLQILSSAPGTLLRYPEPRHGATFAASRDTYTGFAFALGQALPVVHDRKLRAALLADARAVGDHFLDHDFTFRPERGAPLAFNPYPSAEQVEQGLRELANDPDRRQQWVTGLKSLNLYLSLRGAHAWPAVRKLSDALRENRMDVAAAALLPFLQGAYWALQQIQRNVRRSDDAHYIFAPSEMDPRPIIGETSYGKLDRVLDKALTNLANENHEIQKLSDAKVLPSQALCALHLLRVLGNTLPQPNRYETAYEDNLWRNKALLKTLLAWDNMDEDFMEAFLGHTGTAVRRNASRHITFLALYDLIALETDPETRQSYRAVFEQQFRSMQEDQNAMLHVMRGRLGMKPEQLGVGYWSLAQYSTDRRGRGEQYWDVIGDQLAARFGGRVNDQAADPVPVGERQRDSFIWQRSARSLGGDDADKWYPPLDYLFVYWLARSGGLL